MIHIRDKAKELVKVWNKKGFNGVSLSANVEGSDEPEPAGEQTVEQKAEWDKNYVDFLVEADFGEWNVEIIESPYVKVEVDSDRFWHEFREHLKTEFGKDVSISHYPFCNEFEIQRKK